MNSALLNQKILRMLNHAADERSRSTRCWVCFEFSEDPPLIHVVHRRYYLQDEGGTPGLRMVLALMDEVPEEGCVWVFLTTTSTINPALISLAERAQGARVPWLTVQVGANENEIFKIDPSGARKKLTSAALLRSPRRLRVRMQENPSVHAELKLPCILEVSSPATRAALSVWIEDPQDPGHSFRAPSYHFQILSKEKTRTGEARPLGDVRLRLDVRLAADGGDELDLEALGEGSPKVEIESWEENKVIDKSVFSPGTIHLHVVYDRTSLDRDCWVMALDAPAKGAQAAPAERPGGGSAGAELAFGAASPGPAGGAKPPESWNIGWREALGAGLERHTQSLHNDIAFHFWWFADIPREGIAQGVDLPLAQAAWADRGQWENPSEELRKNVYGYATGLDLFDALDEVLLAVVREAKASDKQPRHAVLIVGDSPPPPDSRTDPLWEQLVMEPFITNARTSDGFRRALAELSKLGIPVGWLFLRADVLNERERPDAQARFSECADLNERLFRELQRTKNLAVTGVASPGALAPRLDGLLRRLRRAPGSLEWLSVEVKSEAAP